MQVLKKIEFKRLLRMNESCLATCRDAALAIILCSSSI